MGQINFLTILKDWLSRCNQNKRKTVAPPYHSFNLFFSVTTYHFLPTDSKLAIAIASTCHLCFSSCLHFTLMHFIATQKPCEGNSGKFQESGGSRFSGSEKDHYFLKIPTWQHKLVRDYKRGKLVYYFLNNAGKICLYGPKISENIEIEHVFQPKLFFRFSSNLHISCLSAFKGLTGDFRGYKFFISNCVQLELTIN